MIGKINTGGGSAPIKFATYSSSVELPITADENTIAVITSETVNEYYFSATQPISPTNGMVWIISNYATGNVAMLNTKQSIEVYPAGAKIYASGNWSSIPSFFYKNNAWKSLRFDMITDGVVNLEALSSVVVGCRQSYGIPTISYPSGYMNIYSQKMGAPVWGGIVGFQNKVPFDKYSSLVCDVKATAREYIRIGYNLDSSGQGQNQSNTTLVTWGLSTSAYQRNVLTLSGVPESFLHFEYLETSSYEYNIHLKNLYFI